VTGPIVVIHDGSGTSDRALQLAGDLARRIKTQAAALCLSDTRAASAELTSRVAELAATGGFNLRCHTCTRTDPREVARLARSLGGNMMMAPVRSQILSDQAIEGIVSYFFGPVLLVAERA
jgi:hypothetical protein